MLATEKTLNSSSPRVDREDRQGMTGLLLDIVDWYVLSTELSTDSPNWLCENHVILVSSHCPCYYNG
jgi:hypothetical protein